jgi:hypothetical protein
MGYPIDHHGYDVPDRSAIIPTMTDQPADHDNRVANDRPTTDAGHDRPATDQPPMPALQTLDEAATDLGITVNAVRQRIKRGTLIGIKTDTGWLVDIDHRPATDRPMVGATGQPTNHATKPTDQQPTIDLAPLAEVIDDLTRRNAELAAAAAMWQTRAAHLEGQLKQLGTGETRPDTSSEAPGSPKSDDQSSQGLRTLRAWLRRLWGS